ncbi:MAG TPA: class D sortase, partial [Candidatus Saccharimonadales bacterium]|nr:class D sortase [Candidatus Saccharimonadales bacterium]
KERHIEPSAAVELIRKKIDALYLHEPSAKDELAQPVNTAKPLSKHQRFMRDLSTSGKSLAEIQTLWHNYYIGLPNDEKHEVWQEFYQANQRATSHYGTFIAAHTGRHPSPDPQSTPPHDEHAAAKATVFASDHTADTPKQPRTFVSKRRSVAELKKHVMSHVRASHQAQLKAKKHLQSLIFGLSLGAMSILIFLFGLFNERFIIPFIQPSGRVGATPIILSTDGVAPSPNPELIIPKINVQLPVVYDLADGAEATVQQSLENGVIHYPNTAVPGQQGNAAFFGHSSNNIFNKGKYKFAFVLLHELAPGDIFYLTYDSKVYAYQVYEKKVVEPTDTWVLGAVEGKAATVALITCDPPGTSKHRLVVWGEQISPNPNANAAAPAVDTAAASAELPSEGPTLWTRFWRWVTPW